MDRSFLDSGELGSVDPGRAEHPNMGQLWHGLPEKFEPFPGEFGKIQEKTCHVTPRPGEVLDEPG